MFNSKSNVEFKTKPISILPILLFFIVIVSVFTVVPSDVFDSYGTESLFATCVSLYVFVLYLNSNIYCPGSRFLNTYSPSLFVIAVNSSPFSSFKYSATLSLFICFIFTRIPFSNLSLDSF